MIKVKWVGLVTIEAEADERRPGVMPFEKIVKRFENGRFFDDSVRWVLEDKLSDFHPATVKVQRHEAELWRED